MEPTASKQLALKPQDLVVALKVAVNADRGFLFAELASELSMAVSAVHGSVSRAEQARLLSRATGSLRATPGALREFVSFGARYAYPGALGTLTRGVPTGVAGPVLRHNFHLPGSLQPVWPTADGEEFGLGLIPLHPSVPNACKTDGRLYEVLSLLDAIRVGAARERELAIQELAERLT